MGRSIAPIPGPIWRFGHSGQNARKPRLGYAAAQRWITSYPSADAADDLALAAFAITVRRWLPGSGVERFWRIRSADGAEARSLEFGFVGAVVGELVGVELLEGGDDVRVELEAAEPVHLGDGVGDAPGWFVGA
jgi:hypothetical protein